MILISRILTDTSGLSKLLRWINLFRKLQMASNVRANCTEAWAEADLGFEEGEGGTGGFTISFTTSISVATGKNSARTPQLVPNQNTLVTWHLKNKWGIDSISTPHSGQYGEPLESLEKRFRLVGRALQPIRQISVLSLSCNLHFQSSFQHGSGLPGHMWQWFDLYTDFTEKTPLGSAIQQSLSDVGWRGKWIRHIAVIESSSKNSLSRDIFHEGLSWLMREDTSIELGGTKVSFSWGRNPGIQGTHGSV